MKEFTVSQGHKADRTAPGGRSGSPFRVGLIGYGMAGRSFHAPLIDAEPELILTHVATRQAALVSSDRPGTIVSADPVAIATAPDIDLVVIASPNHTHAPLAMAAIDAGKNVVIDKPFASTFREAQAVTRRAEEKGVLLSVFHNRRWDSDFLSVSDAIGRNEIGAITHFESRLERFEPLSARDRHDPKNGGGVWLDLGAHLVDQAIQLFGLPRAVVADFARQRAGAKSEDWAHVVLLYPERRVILQMGLVAAEPGHRFLIHGTAGTIVKHVRDLQGRQLLAGLKPGADHWGRDPDPLVIVSADGERRDVAATNGDYRSYYAAIAAALLGTAHNPVTAHQALDVMRVLDAALRSADHDSVRVLIEMTERMDGNSSHPDDYGVGSG